MNLSKSIIRRLNTLSTQDLIRWLVYSLVVLIPAVYHPGFDATFTTPKLILFRIITLLIVVVWGVQIIAQSKLILRKSPLNKWFYGYGFVLGITTLFSTYFWVSFYGDQGRFLGLLTMLNLLFLGLVVLNFFQSKGQIKNLIRFSVWTAMILAVYGLLQSKGIVGAESWDHDPTLRVFGTLGHSNHFGAYLAFHFMLLVGLFLNELRFRNKAIYLGGGLIMLSTILATASRGAFFSLVGAIFIFVIGWASFHRVWIWNQRKKVAAAIIVLFIAVGIFHKPLINRVENLSLTQRTVSTIDFMMQGNVPDRVSWWFSSLAMFRDHPVLGHGLSTFRETYNLYRRADYRVPGDIQDTVTPESAHMEYFNILATQGLVGLVIYLGLILCWVRLLWKILVSKDLPKRKKITTLSLLTAGAVYLAQVLMSFGVIATLIPFYIFIGVSGSYYHIVADPDPQTKQFKPINLTPLYRLGGAVLLIVAIFLCSWFTLRQASAEWNFQQAQNLKNQGEVAAMIEKYEATTKRMNKMYSYWESFGLETFNFGVGSTDLDIVKYLLGKSITAYEKAYDLVQTQPYIQSNLGLSYVSYATALKVEGKLTESSEWIDKGEALYAESVTLGVNNPVYAYNYGMLLMGLDRESEAKEAFLHILTFRDPYKDIYTRLAQIEVNAGNHDQASTYVQKALEQNPGDQNAKAVLERINTETTTTAAATTS